MALLRQALKKFLALSAAALLALGLLILNPSPRSLISEAMACDQGGYEVCYAYCTYYCGQPGWPFQECPYWDPEGYCGTECARVYGC